MPYPYVFPATAVSRLKNLAKNYESSAQVKLSDKPSKWAIATGWAKNTPEREENIDFILFWINYFPLDDDINKNELSDLRFFFIACLFIKHKARKGTLKNLIDEDLALNQQTVDENTLFLSIMEARKFTTNKTIDDWTYEIGEEDDIKEIIHPPIQLSKEFILYIEAEFLKAQPISGAPILDSLPITNAFMEVGSKIGEVSGITLALVAGPILAETTSGIPISACIVKGVDAGFHLIVKANTAHILTYFLGHTLSESLLKSFTTVSLAYILKEIGGLLGKAVAIPPGLAFDAMIKILESVGGLIYKYLNPPQPLNFEGRLLTDGAFFKPEKIEPKNIHSDSELIPLNAQDYSIN